MNDHLKGTDPGKYAFKTSLELKIDKSISEGDFERAEKLSDYMSTREVCIPLPRHKFYLYYNEKCFHFSIMKSQKKLTFATNNSQLIDIYMYSVNTCRYNIY